MKRSVASPDLHIDDNQPAARADQPVLSDEPLATRQCRQVDLRLDGQYLGIAYKAT